MMRDLLVESDAPLDVQAWVLRPDVVLKIAGGLVKEQDNFLRTKLAAKLTINELRDAIKAEKVKADRRDMKWLDKMEKAVDKIPDDPEQFYAEIKPELDMDKWHPEGYGLKA